MREGSLMKMIFEFENVRDALQARSVRNMAILSSVLFLLLAVLLLSPNSSAQDYFSGYRYGFSTPYDENYIYLWYASQGSFSYPPGKETSSVIWTAPPVEVPTPVTISVLVKDDRLTYEPDSVDCISLDEIEVTVIPIPNLLGYKWNDKNGNCELDEGEERLPGWTIVIKNFTTDNVVDSVETDAFGYYKFDDIPSGIYTIEEIQEDGWTPTCPEGGTTEVDTTKGTIVQNFGNRQRWITGHKWYDKNGNSVLDDGEEKLSGWTITLRNFTTGEVIGSTLTDEDGKYSFEDVPASIFTVEETLKPGWTPTFPGQGRSTVDTTDGDAIQNFGNRGGLSISGVKFYDPNDTGDKTGKDRLGGWDFTLSKWNETESKWDELTNTTTSSDAATLGQYSFNNLVPSRYRVCETLKDGWEQTWPDTVDGCYEIDDLKGEVPVSKTNADFGNRGDLNIAICKFNDFDGDGEWIDGEPSIPFWSINVTGPYDYSFDGETGESGCIGLRNLPPGEYTVSEGNRVGWVNTTSASETFTLDAADSPYTVSFGNRGGLSISGVKFYDPNDTGDKTGKDRLGGWDITLSKWNETESKWDELTNTTTSSDAATLGQYSFNNLVPGHYKVCETLKDGWEQTWPDTADGCYEFTLMDTLETNVDFGNRQFGSISGYKWNDQNGNCERDEYEEKLNGWNITLRNATTGEYIASTVTDESGHYIFENFPVGKFKVEETPKDGWTPTCPEGGVSEVNTTTGDVVQNFGNRKLGSISGYKWNDENANCKPDKGEDKLEGWTITLMNSTTGEVITSTTTDRRGNYKFEDLPAGMYVVEETQQDGWVPTCPEDGVEEVEVTYEGRTVNFGNMQPVVFEVRKVALNTSVKRCEEITYKIQIKTDLEELNNVTVKDIFDKKVEFVSASPPPDDDGIWRLSTVNVGRLDPDEDDPDWRTLITLVVRVPDKQDLEYDMVQGVAGYGFVNVKNDYSTTYQSYVITNSIELTTDTIPGEVFKDSARVTVTIDPGTELSTREHGSGTYESDELVHVRTENKSISMDKDMAATYSSTTLGLYNNRTVTYSSRWTETADAKNRVTGASMSEQYRYATTIDRESSIFLDENESVMNIDSEFDGMGHIGFLKMPTNNSTHQDKPIIEIREDYVGSFRILERVDEYGSSVSYEKAAAGSGFTVGDRRVKDSQRSYESGTGEYDSEEIIETGTNYIAKDISLVSGPMNRILTDDVSISASQKWEEGMYSTTPGTSYIGEEYTSLDYLDKETIARGINEMNIEASFEGRARFRALMATNQSDPDVDIDEQYEGDYSIERHVLFKGVPKYDKPHLNVTKTLDSLVDEDDPCDEEDEGECTETRQVATYTIAIENDGNVALEPVYVTDNFPPGAVFIQPSSLRPEELTDTLANWTLTHLAVGDMVTITLRLDVTNYHPDELVNRVDVCGVYDNETVCARNFSALEIDWLACCPTGPLSVKTSAELDEENQSVVHYRIEIWNTENVMRVATVTDWLPGGMELIDSSTPVASYDGDVVVWNLIEIEPFETATIEFSTLVPGNGRFMNTVEVDPRSVDGPVIKPMYDTCVIDVGFVEAECSPISCGIWQPPNWEFEHYGYEPNELTCEDLACTECNGTESCLAP